MQETLCIGDEVQYIGNETRFVITSIDKDGHLNGIGLNGVAFCDKNPEMWVKTGRHFVEAELLIDAMAKGC